MNREVCGICWRPYDDNGACGCEPQTGASMTTQPEALRLAECLDEPLYATHKRMTDAAACRPRTICLEVRQTSCAAWRDEVHRLYAQRDALLEALKPMIDHAEFWINHHQKRHMSEQEFKLWLALGHESSAMLNARAAIKMVEETK
jgi:hypothetical protein